MTQLLKTIAFGVVALCGVAMAEGAGSAAGGTSAATGASSGAPTGNSGVGQQGVHDDTMSDSASRTQSSNRDYSTGDAAARRRAQADREAGQGQSTQPSANNQTGEPGTTVTR